MHILGIDPGFSGGLVIIDENEDVIAKLTMPVNKIKNKSFIETRQIVSFIMLHGVDVICVEQVGSMPGQGVSSTFSFAYSAGIMEGIAIGMLKKFIKVRPQEWMKQILVGLPKQDKASIVYAGRVKPEIDWRATPRCKKAHDGLTDAYCIALYAKRLIHQTNI